MRRRLGPSPEKNRLHTLHECQAFLAPSRFITEHGIQAYFSAVKQHSKTVSPKPASVPTKTFAQFPVQHHLHSVVPRKSNPDFRTSGPEATGLFRISAMTMGVSPDLPSTTQINDALNPVRCFASVLHAHKFLSKSKTKEEWTVVQQWIQLHAGLSGNVFSDSVTVEKLSKVLCTVWSDQAALAHVCGVFVDRVLMAIAEEAAAADSMLSGGGTKLAQTPDNAIHNVYCSSFVQSRLYRCRECSWTLTVCMDKQLKNSLLPAAGRQETTSETQTTVDKLTDVLVRFTLACPSTKKTFLKRSLKTHVERLRMAGMIVPAESTPDNILQRQIPFNP